MEMADENQEEKVLLPHHEQQTLCTTRLPYRQGRKLTAIKVYTVNSESNHLLIFGVPSLKLRQEARSLFAKFGKLLQFAVTAKYPTEPFTENYHAIFERIQSARIAKKMLDTKNFYGGSLHVCYAPELEEITETRNKILQRQKDVLNRLRNLQKEDTTTAKDTKQKIMTTTDVVVLEHKKLYMGEVNVIGVGNQIRDVVLNKNKRKKLQQQTTSIKDKKLKPSFSADTEDGNSVNKSNDDDKNKNNNTKTEENNSNNKEIEIIDFTSVDTDTITNLNETLNYNNFGKEIIKRIPEKPVNKIKFNIRNKR